MRASWSYGRGAQLNRERDTGSREKVWVLAAEESLAFLRRGDIRVPVGMDGRHFDVAVPSTSGAGKHLGASSDRARELRHLKICRHRHCPWLARAGFWRRTRRGTPDTGPGEVL